MATVYLLDSVKVATPTTGTGSVTVGAAEPGYLTPAEAGAVDGRVYTWRLDDGDDFEIFRGTYSSSGPTVSRDAVLVSKVSGVVGTSKLNLSGSASLSCVPSREDLVTHTSLAETGALAAGYIFGLAIANNATDVTNAIDIATGKCRSDDDSDNIVLSSGLTKRLDAAWAPGSGEGGRDSGPIANGWWYVWVIKNPTTDVVDALFSLSPTSPTLPSGFTKKRRIAAFHRADGAIREFVQVAGDPGLFLFKQPVVDLQATDQGTTAVNRTVTVPPNMVWVGRAEALATVPPGQAMVVVVRDTLTNDVDPNVTDDGLGRSLRANNVGSAEASVQAAGHFELPVDGSSQIATRANRYPVSVRLGTRGWRDYGVI